MTSRSRHLTLLFSLVAVLLAAALPSPAQASPDGDDDPTYNAGSAFGTRYSSLASERSGNLTGARPVTDQAPDGSSVTATLLETFNKGRSEFYLRLTRFGTDGLPAGFVSQEVDLDDEDAEYEELLDLRVLADGTFVVLIAGSQPGNSQTLFLRHYDANGAEVANSDRTYGIPEDCVPDDRGFRGISGYLQAARVGADGSVHALWDCAFDEEESPDVTTRGDQQDPDFDTYVAYYGPGAADQPTSTDTAPVTDSDYGEDLELGPNGDPYVLTGSEPTNGSRLEASSGTSNVTHFTAAGLDEVGQSGDVSGLPIDLAVDSQARPVVWTEPRLALRGAGNDWNIWRLTADLSDLDSSWGDNGAAVVSDPRLGFAYERKVGSRHYHFLTVRPGDKVLAEGRYEEQEAPERQLDDESNGIIAGLTSAGQTDTGFATNGFKVLEYAADQRFVRIGEPTLQSDGKILVPHTSALFQFTRIAAPQDEQDVGVTRLITGPTPSVTPVVPGAAPVRPSATPTICGRRAISLVRADVKGNKVKLTGLVGAALYGKRVTIQTDPKGARNSKFTKTGTVTASKTTGSFTATVPRPKASQFISVRYRAVSGSAKSPSLKLPQRLTSRSVKSAKNTITVKGKVKKSVLGKRNKVLIRRLVCGRYRTVGSAKPDANGNYTVTFASTQIRGVAFYRAESKVLRKPGSKKYVIQYARAIAIRTTSQTG